ncbi:hypothetical protein LTR08_009055 [Meristemomyces frigidus]|nr:hypothetical protein LTR08_009055 [Meristemomyces frigidus]
MSGWLRPRNIAIIGGIGAAAFLFPRTVAKAPIPNVFETSGAGNIGDAWSRGGGSKTSTPGAATKRGSVDDTTTNQTNPSGVDTAHFKDRQSDQKVGEPGITDSAYRQAHLGNSKGK